MAYAAALGALVNIGTNLLWIPRWGMMGAALATLAAYAAMALFLYFLGRKLYPIPYEWKRLLHLAGVVFLILAFAHGMGLGVGEGRLGLRLGLLALFPAALYLTGFFNEEEKTALKKLFLAR